MIERLFWIFVRLFWFVVFVAVFNGIAPSWHRIVRDLHSNEIRRRTYALRENVATQLLLMVRVPVEWHSTEWNGIRRAANVCRRWLTECDTRSSGPDLLSQSDFGGQIVAVDATARSLPRMDAARQTDALTEHTACSKKMFTFSRLITIYIEFDLSWCNAARAQSCSWLRWGASDIFWAAAAEFVGRQCK